MSDITDIVDELEFPRNVNEYTDSMIAELTRSIRDTQLWRKLKRGMKIEIDDEEYGIVRKLDPENWMVEVCLFETKAIAKISLSSVTAIISQLYIYDAVDLPHGWEDHSRQFSKAINPDIPSNEVFRPFTKKRKQGEDAPQPPKKKVKPASVSLAR